MDLNTLLEYAGTRFSEGDHLAEAVLLDLAEGRDPIELRDEAVRHQAYLTAYFADCLVRIQEETTLTHLNHN